MEKLNLGHRKATPLTDVSEDFLKRHPHRYLDLFIGLSRGKASSHRCTWRLSQYQTDLFAAFEQVRLLQNNPATGKPYAARESIDIVQERMTSRMPDTRDPCRCVRRSREALMTARTDDISSMGCSSPHLVDRAERLPGVPDPLLAVLQLL